MFLPTTPNPEAIQITDVDGDADQDLVVVHAQQLRVWSNNGAGAFSFFDQPGLWSHLAHDVAAGDFDRDGDQDLALAVSGLGSNGYPDGTGRVAVLFNQGGRFAPAVLYDSPGSTHSITAADFNGDGAIDLASTGVSFRASIFLNDGRGGFSRIGDFGNGYTSTAIMAADFDADGDPDIAFANPGISQISVLINRNDGTFGNVVFYPCGDNCSAVIAADVDQDSDLDLVAANTYSHDVSVLRNNGLGTFAVQSRYRAGSAPRDLAALDVDSDGALDLVVADRDANVLVVLTNAGDGSFLPPVSLPVGSGPARVATGDLNRDSLLDVAVLDTGSLNVALLFGSTAPSEPPPSEPPPSEPPPGVEIELSVAVRSNKPRRVDLEWTGATTAAVSVRRNGSMLAQTANDGQFTDQPPDRGTYRYAICQDAPAACSNEVTVRFTK
jgi:hypothetical protein